jgi:hypothetical protein
MKRCSAWEPMFDNKDRFYEIIEEHATVLGASGGMPVCPMLYDLSISEEGIELLIQANVKVVDIK